MNQQQEKSNKFLTILGTVLCIILVPILIINCTLIAKSFLNKDDVPSIGGYMPLIVLTDSMYPTIESGDLIICHVEDAEDIEVGDIISFFDPAGNGTSIVTHRVLEVTEQDGEIAFRTKGDGNNTEDQMLVPADKLVSVYQSRIPGAGNVAMFMQTTPGLIVCVVLPLVLLVGYDFVRRSKYEKSQKQDTEALLAELERLRAESAQNKNDSAE
jgi:signal peptidase